MYDFFWFSIFVATNGLILIFLTVNVSRLRMKNRIPYGDKGNKDLMKAIRVHANGTEQVPIFALMVLALSLLSSSATLLASLVIVFTLSRLIHAYGMLATVPVLRQAGAAITYVLQVIAASTLLINGF